MTQQSSSNVFAQVTKIYIHTKTCILIFQEHYSYSPQTRTNQSYLSMGEYVKKTIIYPYAGILLINKCNKLLVCEITQLNLKSIFQNERSQPQKVIYCRVNLCDSLINAKTTYKQRTVQWLQEVRRRKKNLTTKRATQGHF